MAECNGTEFERTANVFDMMYVPDDTDFDIDEARDEATEEVKGYKGNDFVTDVSGATMYPLHKLTASPFSGSTALKSQADMGSRRPEPSKGVASRDDETRDRGRRLQGISC
jgi:hypothetical protein